MNQFNAKQCCFASNHRGRPKGITHRFYRGPSTHCTRKNNRNEEVWHEDTKVTPPKPKHSSARSGLAARAKPEHTQGLESAPRAPERAASLSSNQRFHVCIVWVRQVSDELSKTTHLFNYLSNEGMDIGVIETSNIVNIVVDDIAHCDLILFECLGPLESEMRAAVDRIRIYSRAPLLLLTDDQPAAWAIDALHAGADAIFTVSTPDEVILARCNALLRRWLASA